MATCINCNNGFDSKRADAKFCSGACRTTYSRSIKQNENISLDEPKESIFYFRTPDKTTKTKLSADIRSATVWYKVPLCAIPVIKKGYPDKPDYMDGRQYFLWWKNDFKISEKTNLPVIFNPYPKYDKLEYYQAGDNSRRWGA